MKMYNNGPRKGMMYGGMATKKKPRKKAQAGGMMTATPDQQNMQRNRMKQNDMASMMPAVKPMA